MLSDGTVVRIKDAAASKTDIDTIRKVKEALQTAKASASHMADEIKAYETFLDLTGNVISSVDSKSGIKQEVKQVAVEVAGQAANLIVQALLERLRNKKGPSPAIEVAKEVAGSVDFTALFKKAQAEKSGIKIVK